MAPRPSSTRSAGEADGTTPADRAPAVSPTATDPTANAAASTPSSPPESDHNPAAVTPGTPVANDDAARAVAQVRTKQYADASWEVGRPAPSARYRVYDDAGVLGAPRAKALQPGESGVVVVLEGDTVTPGVRRALGADTV